MLKKYVWVSLLFIFFLIFPSQAVYVACTNGTSATIDVNWTFTGAPGTDALIVNIGDEHNARLDITIPTGNDGSDGAANMTAGPQGEKGDKGDQGLQGVPGTQGVNGTTQDVSQFPFLNGNRTMTGIWNIGGFNLSNLLDPISAQDAATKNYVDTRGFITSTYNATYDGQSNYNSSYITSTYNSTYDSKPSSTYNATYDAKTNYNTSYWTGTNYNASYWTGTNYNASYLTSTYNATYDANSNYNSSYLTSTYNATYDSKPSSTYNATYDAKNNYNSSYWTGTNYNASYLTSTYNSTYDANSNYNASYLTSTYNATYDAKPSSTFNATYDAKTNYNASYWTGTNYNASYWTGTNYNATYDGQSNYNASYLTSTYNATYDAKSNYNASYMTSTYNATYDSKPSSTYNATYDSKPSSTYNSTYDSKPSSTYNSTYDAKISNPVFGYLTLMAGSGMLTTTNPGTMNQWETATNKNNFIYWNFTDGGTETVQWIVDFPADWNSSANVIFTPIWTAQGGSGTVNFTVSGKLFPNDAAIDTALVSIGSSVDTLITVGDMHVSPDTTGAAISSVATGGNTAIIKVARDSSSDTLSGTAQLLGLRIKYARILA